MYSCTSHFECGVAAVRAVRFNADGNYCLTCQSDKTLKLWNPYKKLLIKSYAGHNGEVLDAQGSCDNSQIISGGSDKSVILWDVIKVVPIRRYCGHLGSVTTVSFNEDGTAAITGSIDNTVRFWDIRSKNRNAEQVLSEAGDCVTQLRVTNYEILTGSLDCKIRRYDIRMGSITEDYINKPVTAISFTVNRECMLASCSDSVLRLIDKDTGQLLAKYTGHSTDKFYIENCVDNSGNYVFSGSSTGVIWCWDLVSMVPVHQFIHTEGRVVNSLSFHPSKQSFLSASKSDIKLWSREEL